MYACPSKYMSYLIFQVFVLNTKFERRRSNRFKVPEAKVVYEQESGFFNTKDFVGTKSLTDLSLVSVKFESKHQFTPGAQIKIEILLEDGQIIPLIGNILLISLKSFNNTNLAVSEFTGFSPKEGLNPLETKAVLQYLSNKYDAISSKVIFNF